MKTFFGVARRGDFPLGVELGFGVRADGVRLGWMFSASLLGVIAVFRGVIGLTDRVRIALRGVQDGIIPVSKRNNRPAISKMSLSCNTRRPVKGSSFTRVSASASMPSRNTYERLICLEK